MAPSYECPCCGARLLAARAPDVTMLACKQCAGVWLDNAGSRLAAEARLSEFAQQVARMLDKTRPSARRATVDPYRSPASGAAQTRRCPICAGPLSRAMVAVARTELDICAAHGTWFDRHELWAVVQAVAVQNLDEEFEVEKDLRRAREMTREANRGSVLGGGSYYRRRDPGLEAVGLIVDALLR